jgi:hypothetical protein
VWVLPVDDLMSLAQASTERSLTNDECRPFIDETTMLEDYGRAARSSAGWV